MRNNLAFKVNTTFQRLSFFFFLHLLSLPVFLNGQRSSHLGFSQSNLTAVNKTETAIFQELNQGELLSKEQVFGYGKGIEWGLHFSSIPDSFGLFWNLGINHFNGISMNKSSWTNKDLDSTAFSFISHSQFFFQTGLGFISQPKYKFRWNTSIGLNIPLISSLEEINSFRSQNGFENIKTKIKTTLLPGFWSKLGIGYAFSSHILFNVSGYFCFHNLNEKSASIVAYSNSQSLTLTERYPTVSERETRFVKDINNIQNNPNLLPNQFDKNKATDNIANTLSASRAGIEFTIAYKLGK